MPLIIPSSTNADSRDKHQPLPPQGEIPNSLFGASLPPVLSNLVKRIEEKKFIEMAELLPERLAAYTPDDDLTKASKSKRVPDLVGYQALIIDAQREHQGECWIGYDCLFRHYNP